MGKGDSELGPEAGGIVEAAAPTERWRAVCALLPFLRARRAHALVVPVDDMRRACVGRWLVHLTTTGGGVTTCAALPGPFRIKCVFEDETIVVDRFNFSQTKATLTLEFVP